MVYWMTGEIYKDADAGFSTVRSRLERGFKKCMSKDDFGSGIKKLTVILIIVPPAIAHIFPETQKYYKTKCNLELRVSINHKRFVSSALPLRGKLAIGAICRAVKQFCSTSKIDFDSKRFINNFKKLNAVFADRK